MSAHRPDGATGLGCSSHAAARGGGDEGDAVQVLVAGVGTWGRCPPPRRRPRRPRRGRSGRGGRDRSSSTMLHLIEDGDGSRRRRGAVHDAHGDDEGLAAGAVRRRDDARFRRRQRPHDASFIASAVCATQALKAMRPWTTPSAPPRCGVGGEAARATKAQGSRTRRCGGATGVPAVCPRRSDSAMEAG